MHLYNKAKHSLAKSNICQYQLRAVVPNPIHYNNYDSTRRY